MSGAGNKGYTSVGDSWPGPGILAGESVRSQTQNGSATQPRCRTIPHSPRPGGMLGRTSCGNSTTNWSGVSSRGENWSAGMFRTSDSEDREGKVLIICAVFEVA